MAAEAPADPYRLARHFGFAGLATAFLCAAVSALLRAAGAYEELRAFSRSGVVDELSFLPSPVEGMAFTFESLAGLFTAMGILGLLLGGTASWDTRAGRRAVAGAALLLTTYLALGPGMHLLPDAPRQVLWEASNTLAILLMGASLALAVSGAASRAATLAIAMGTLAHLVNELVLPTITAMPYPERLGWGLAPALLLALGSALFAGGLAAHVAAERTRLRERDAGAAVA